MYRLSIGLTTLAILFLMLMSISALGTESTIERIELKPKFTHFTTEKQREIQCMAKNIYFEARSEPKVGQVAVAFVTINRMYSPDFPNTLCGVVEQRTPRVCQFSWLCEEKPSYIYRNNLLTINHNPLYNEIRDLATYVYANYEILNDPTYGALFYHADYVNPRWNRLERINQIGRHIFYRPKEI
jgi:spore germination cell wall hydrolase CwlJ-like protein